MPILQTSDFGSGELAVPKTRYTDIAQYFAKYEEYYLLRLLGADLYALFKADLSGTPSVPVSPVYLTIFNKFAEDSGNGLVLSEGIKEMLRQFVYFHFMRDSVITKTSTGQAKALLENAENVGFLAFNLVESYNLAVENARAIQWKITEDAANYPSYNGQFFEYMSGI